MSTSSCGARAALADEVAARVDHLAGAVEVDRELAVLVVLESDPVRLQHEVAVRDRGARPLDLPEAVRQTGLGRVRVEHHVRAVQAELAPAFGEVPVVADVDADLADGGVEHRVAEVAGAEVELLPEPVQVRQVVLAVLAEDRAVGIDDDGRVVVHAGDVLLVDREDHDHVQLGGQLREALHDGSVGGLGVAVVLLVLGDAEVRPVEELLEADHLRALGGGIPRELLVLVEHRVLVACPGGLGDCRAYRRHAGLRPSSTDPLGAAFDGDRFGCRWDRPPLFDLGPSTFPVDFSLCPDSKRSWRPAARGWPDTSADGCRGTRLPVA